MTQKMFATLEFDGVAKVTGLPTPVSASDAVIKSYVDNLFAGLSWKDNVRVASTAAVTLVSGVENGDVLDGVTLATGDSVLLKNQASASENGIYTVNATGAPTRRSDSDNGVKVVGTVVQVDEGTTNANSIWIMTTNAPITINSTSLAFSQLQMATYTNSDGSVTIVGTVISAVAATGGGLSTAGGAGMKLDTAIAVRKAAAFNFGDGTALSFNYDHNLGNLGVHVEVFDGSGNLVGCEVQNSTTNRSILTFSSPPTALQYTAYAIG